jgi:hypothetical protein
MRLKQQLINVVVLVSQRKLDHIAQVRYTVDLIALR